MSQKSYSDHQTASDHDDASEDYSVPSKFRGSTNDEHEMAVLGKAQALRRNFHLFTMLGFASVVMVGWETLPIYLLYCLIDGGTPIVFWGLLIAPIGMTLVYASIAEIASMYPISSGQFHWVSELSPPSMQRGLSYTVGWLTAIGWQTYSAASSYLVATLIQGLIQFNDPTYEAQRWHGTLLTIGFALLAIFYNTILAGRLPGLQACAVVLHIGGCIAIAGTLWGTASVRRASDVILNFQDNGGWGNTGLSSMIGLFFPFGLLVGYDCSVHISEETYDASTVIPRGIMWGAPLNALLNIFMGIALIFCLENPTEMLESTAIEPFIGSLFYKATGSKAGTSVMVAVVIILLSVSCVSQLTAASRQLWAFARDGGLPRSSWISKVPRKWNIPVPAIIVTFTITCLLSLINIGSSVALNAFNSLASVSVLFSYLVTIGCVISRRILGPELPPRRWSLGKWGMLINILSLVFITPILFFDFWPLMQPVTAQNFNWSSVMFAGVSTIAAINYVVSARFMYTGPVADVKRE